MEPGSFLLILALVVLVGLVVTRPLMDPIQRGQKKQGPVALDNDRSVLLAERDRLLRSLKELDFDHLLGKIPEEDYPSQRQNLLQRGVNILQKLDQYELAESANGLELQLEAAISAHRVELSDLSHAPNGNGRKPVSRIANAVVASPDDDLEVLLANRRRARGDKANGFCPNCGSPHQTLDRFCPRCGAKISPQEE
jgi:hypothetical protein